MMKTIRLLMAAALLCSVATAQSALTFASYAGATAPAGIANGPLTWTNDAGTGAVTLDYDGGGAAPLTGMEYVTWAQGSGAALGVTTYTTTSTGNLAGYTGTVMVEADDYATVTLNGVVLGVTEPGQYNSVQSFDVPPIAYVNGVNTLTIAVTNTLGYTGVGFLATAVPPVCAVGVTTRCTLPTNAVHVGDEGSVVTILSVTAPVVVVYCAGMSCNPPATFGVDNPFLISGTPMLGGPLPNGATGSLYVLPGGTVTLTTAIPGPVVSIPSAP